MTSQGSELGSRYWRHFNIGQLPIFLIKKLRPSETHSPSAEAETNHIIHNIQERPRVSSWEDSKLGKPAQRQRNMARTIPDPSTYSYSCNIIPKPKGGTQSKLAKWRNRWTEEFSPAFVGAVLGCRPHATSDLGPCVWSFLRPSWATVTMLSLAKCVISVVIPLIFPRLSFCLPISLYLRPLTFISSKVKLFLDARLVITMSSWWEECTMLLRV